MTFTVLTIALGRIPQPQPQCRCAGGGLPARPFISSIAPSKEAPSGAPPRSPHDEEERISQRAGLRPSLAEEHRSGLLHRGGNSGTNPAHGHSRVWTLFRHGRRATDGCLAGSWMTVKGSGRKGYDTVARSGSRLFDEYQ